MIRPKIVAATFVFSAVLVAADPFVGFWRLNIEESDLAGADNVKGGRTRFQPLGRGYVYTAGITFANNNVARLQGPVLFDGTISDTRLDGRPVSCVSKRLSDSSYETVITDQETGLPTNTFRYVVHGDTLTFHWLDGAERPMLVLVYDRE
jgi:hypothetical protein